MPDLPTDWIEAALLRYERPLIQYALGLTNGDLEQARDVVQDAFLRLSRQETPPTGEHLGAWLFTVCRNRALDHYRKSSRLIYLEPDAMNETPTQQPLPSAALELREEAESLERLLDRLPQNQREVIRLKFQHDLSYREISDITQLSTGNVGFLLHTGLRRLRELFQQLETTPLKRKIG